MLSLGQTPADHPRRGERRPEPLQPPLQREGHPREAALPLRHPPHQAHGLRVRGPVGQGGGVHGQPGRLGLAEQDAGRLGRTQMPKDEGRGPGEGGERGL